jgi:magnesium chelatase subunit I
MDKTQFPFAAIVGQEKMKKALLLNLINPRIGGLLIKGEKGTAKSTIVRAAAQLLPELNVIELPLGATEDKVVGTLDIEQAIKKGEKKFEAGILAKADNNILYVDEVNLLEDHIVDILLDVAAMGVNTVEREGISYSHPSRFILIGTMNPEEGDLRPQLLDRFGLTLDVIGESDVESRIEIMKRRLAFEADPEQLINDYAEEQNKLTRIILKAREKLADITCPENLYELIAKLSVNVGVDGHRADIIILKTAITLACYYQKNEVSDSDIYEAAELVLPHRLHRLPFDEKELSADKLREMIYNINNTLALN